MKLSLSQLVEMEDYFNDEPIKEMEVKATIDNIAKAIDAMVYEFYGLSEEEIAVIENT